MTSKALGVAFAALGLLVTGCGSSSETDAGAEACGIYRDALKNDPAALTSIDALPKIKDMLSDLDRPTKRAFADLITAADTDIFSREPGAVEAAAAEVRSTCLAEHDVEIPS